MHKKGILYLIFFIYTPFIQYHVHIIKYLYFQQKHFFFKNLNEHFVCLEMFVQQKKYINIYDNKSMTYSSYFAIFFASLIILCQDLLKLFSMKHHKYFIIFMKIFDAEYFE